MRRLSVATENFPLRGKFVIARGARTEAVVVVASLFENEFRGRGECVPYSRYGETVGSVLDQIEAVRPRLEQGATREDLPALLPAGAARNALDCALWDLDAKRLGLPVRDLAGVHRVGPATTAYTVSLGTPASMAAAARAAAWRPVLKIKLGGRDDVACLAAVAKRRRIPISSSTPTRAGARTSLLAISTACIRAGVVLIEQPLPAEHDAALAQEPRPIPVCADESVHDRSGLAALRNRYDVINIKLDKTGGLTEALALADAAERLGFGLMVGCMVGSSLAMAPAMLLTPRARFVDLDGPLLLASDREHGLRYDGSLVYPPEPALWG